MGLLSQFTSKAELHRRETIKRFDEFMASYFDGLEAAASAALDELSVTLVARSPESPVAAAVLRHADRLAVAGCHLQAIFVNIEPAADFTEFSDLVGSCNGQSRIAQSIRWARNPALLEAHEQLVLGTSHCWSGDSMRRGPDVRFALDLFSSEGGRNVELGRFNFDGLWSVASSVPRSRFRSVAAPQGEGDVVGFDNLREGARDLTFTSSAVTRH